MTPGKSNIAHAYAAAYANGLLYFGQDKPASSGVNAVGFWFFQNPVGLDAGPTSGHFVGTHREGDLLITSDFTNGGNTSIINIFKWESGALVLKKTSSVAGVECQSPASNAEIACMISNKTSTFTAQWPPFPPGTSSISSRSSRVVSISPSSMAGWTRFPVSRTSSPTRARRLPRMQI